MEASIETDIHTLFFVVGAVCGAYARGRGFPTTAIAAVLGIGYSVAILLRYVFEPSWLLALLGFCLVLCGGMVGVYCLGYVMTWLREKEARDRK